MTVTRTLAGAAAAIALVGGAIAIPAIAQDATEPTPSEAPERTREHARAEHDAAFAAALAEELGLPVEDVQAALEAVRERLHAERRAERLEHLTERLDAAVADGSLTQEQADAILEAAEAGVFPDRGERRGPHHHRPFRGGPPAPDGA